MGSSIKGGASFFAPENEERQRNCVHMQLVSSWLQYYRYLTLVFVCLCKHVDMCPQLVHVRRIKAVYKEAVWLDLGIGKAAWVVLYIQPPEGLFKCRSIFNAVSVSANHYYWSIWCSGLT